MRVRRVLDKLVYIFISVFLALFIFSAAWRGWAPQSEEAKNIDDQYFWHYKHCAEDPDFYERFGLQNSPFIKAFSGLYPYTNEEIENSSYHQTFSCECIGDALFEYPVNSTGGQIQILEKISAECTDQEQMEDLRIILSKDWQGDCSELKDEMIPSLVACQIDKSCSQREQAESELLAERYDWFCAHGALSTPDQ